MLLLLKVLLHYCDFIAVELLQFCYYFVIVVVVVETVVMIVFFRIVTVPKNQ